MEGRPIIVYDEPDITKPSPEILKKNGLRRLPGRDISISSSEEELSSGDDEELSEIAKQIVIVEDPVKKLPPPPRKSSLHHPTNSRPPSKSTGWERQASLDDRSTSPGSGKSLRGGQAIGVRSAGSTHKLSLEVPTVLEVNGEAAEDAEADDGFPERNRKRSVSFHSLVIAEETAPVYEEQTSPSPNASSPSTKDQSTLKDSPSNDDVFSSTFSTATTSKSTSAKSATIDSHHLTVEKSETARQRRKSIETMVRPPTPPRHFN